MFGGGFNVGINVKAKKIIYNDILQQLVNLFQTLQTHNKSEILQSISDIINTYNLPTYKCTEEQEENNKLAYLKLRADYNKLNINSYKKDIMFYTLVCHSFSNQIRFNSKNEFNLPYGKRYFNQNLQTNFELFLYRLKIINVKFLQADFTQFSVDELNHDDFIYSDPPYLITCATYNERGGWNEENEYILLNLLDKVNAKGVKFALSNVLESNGKSNDILKAWSGKYIVHRLDCDYGNANYHKKDKSKNSTIEVLITNY